MVALANAESMEDTLTLTELLLHAEQFCRKVEAAAAVSTLTADEVAELRLKISQARNVLSLLQRAFEEDQLTIENTSVRANFRLLTLTLLWVAFGARHAIDHRAFRMLVMIESSFSYLLVTRR